MDTHQQSLHAAANACERVANSRTPEERRLAVLQVMQHRITLQVAGLQAGIARQGSYLPGHERKALKIEGDEYGEVEARIPKKLFFHLVRQKNMGLDGIYSDEGMRDLKQAFPFIRTKYVSNTVSFSRGGRWSGAKSGATFGKGVLHLAN